MSKRGKRNGENAEIIIIPIGYNIKDYLDTDDSDFDEPPIKVKEVNVRYEQQDDRTRTDDG